MKMHDKPKRRLNAIAEANRKQKSKSLWGDPRSYGVLFIGTMIGAGIAPAIAAQNAFDKPYVSVETKKTTTSVNGENSATGSGQQAISDKVSNDGGSASGNTAGGELESKYELEEEADVIVRDDVKEAAIACADPENKEGIAAYHQKKFEEMKELAMVQTPTDAIFNPTKDTTDPATGEVISSGIAGCFSASSEIINLAELMPPMNGNIWSAISNQVQTAIQEKLKQKQEELIERGCSVANNAVRGAIAPINTFLTAAAESKALSDPAGFLGQYIAEQAGDRIDQVDFGFNDALDNLDDKISEQNRQATNYAREKSRKFSEVDSLVRDTSKLSFDTSPIENAANNGQSGVLSSNIENARQNLREVENQQPPPIRKTGKHSNRKYYECPTGDDCTRISREKYYEIASEHQRYPYLLEGAKQRLEAAIKNKEKYEQQAAATRDTQESDFVANNTRSTARSEPNTNSITKSIADFASSFSPSSSQKNISESTQKQAPAPADEKPESAPVENKPSRNNPYG